MIEGINSVPKSKEVPSQKNTGKKKRPPNAYKDWKKVKILLEEMLRQGCSGKKSQMTEQQKSMNDEICTVLFENKRVKKAKGSDCIGKYIENLEKFKELFFK